MNLTIADPGVPALGPFPGSPLAEALAKAQGEIKNPAKKSENPHFRSRYADLAIGLEAIRPVLSKYGIAMIQSTRIKDDMLILDSYLVHSSGERVSSEWPVAPVKTPPQQMGSALTYARRYAGFALVGIAGQDDDDDGNAAQAKAPDMDAATGQQIADVKTGLAETNSNVPAFLKVLGASDLDSLTRKQAEDGLALIRKKKGSSNG